MIRRIIRHNFENSVDNSQRQMPSDGKSSHNFVGHVP
jgi:hypothetical protein